MQTTETNTTHQVGNKVACSGAFTSPIGAHFAKGSIFTVEIVGVSIALRADACGSRVWISDGAFLTR